MTFRGSATPLREVVSSGTGGWGRRSLRRIFPDYKSLAGYLERTTLLRVGRLHVRIHRIRSADKTPFLHSHPFSYLSVILRGGYVEQTDAGYTEHRRGAMLWRPSSLHHRLELVQPDTLTLFVTWERKDKAWSLKRPAALSASVPWVDYPRGVYKRLLYGRERFCKFDEFWHIACDSEANAWAAVKPSIDQTTRPSILDESRTRAEQGMPPK